MNPLVVTLRLPVALLAHDPSTLSSDDPFLIALAHIAVSIDTHKWCARHPTPNDARSSRWSRHKLYRHPGVKNLFLIAIICLARRSTDRHVPVSRILYSPRERCLWIVHLFVTWWSGGSRGTSLRCAKESAFLLIFSIIAQHANISFSFPLCIFVYPSSSSLQPRNFLQVCPPLLRTSLVLFFIVALRTNLTSYSFRNFACSTLRVYARPFSRAHHRCSPV